MVLGQGVDPPVRGENLLTAPKGGFGQKQTKILESFRFGKNIIISFMPSESVFALMLEHGPFSHPCTGGSRFNSKTEPAGLSREAG